MELTACSFFVFLLFVQAADSLIAPGSNNPYYLIESYYGSFSKEFNTSDAILNDHPVTFQWCTNFDYDSTSGRVYFADRTTHTIQYRDLSTEQTVVMAGISGYPGYRDGDFSNTLFYSPTALKIFRYDVVKAQQARNAISIILNSGPTEACQYATYYNYSGCQNTSAVGAELVTDPSLVLTLYPNFNASAVTDADNELAALSGNIMFVMDRENSCVRKLDLVNGVSTTFAGQCETEGFMDGPFYVNLFNKPDSFGIDDLGYLFILDAGNQYIRVAAQNSYVWTLLKGACNEANKQGTNIVDNLQTRYVTCYRDWNKTSGLPDSHIFTPLTDLEMCFENDVLCGGRNRSHPVLYKNSTFRGLFNNETSE